MLKNFTKKIFKKEVLESKEPVLVDFWAEWCGPCKTVAPVVEELAKELKGKVKVGKVNIEKEEGLASKYGVMSIPTFLVFDGGKVVEQASGAMPKKGLLKLVKKVLK